jgi:hypothetical protein
MWENQRDGFLKLKGNAIPTIFGDAGNFLFVK